MMQPSTRPVSVLDSLERALARGMSDLPTLPRGASDALRLARKPEVDYAEIEAVAGQYPPLAARVLSVANSALYRRPGVARIASVRRATARLGTQSTRDVLYQVAYATLFVDVPRYRDLIEATFRRGVDAAQIARAVAPPAGLDADTAFLSALLYDVGRARCWKLVAGIRGGADMTEAEAAVDVLHTRAGAELATAWQLPEEVVEACLWHHAPEGRRYATLAASCDALVDAGEPRLADARAHLSALGLDSLRVDALLARAARGSWAEPNPDAAPTSQ